MNEEDIVLPTLAEIEGRLEALNAAIGSYATAEARDVKNRAEQRFNECYDWLANRHIPIYYDEQAGLYRLVKG